MVEGLRILTEMAPFQSGMVLGSLLTSGLAILLTSWRHRKGQGRYRDRRKPYEPYVGGARSGRQRRAG